MKVSLSLRMPSTGVIELPLEQHLMGTSYSGNLPCSDHLGTDLHYSVYLVQQIWADSDGGAESAADAVGASVALASEGNAGAAVAAAEKCWMMLQPV